MSRWRLEGGVRVGAGLEKKGTRGCDGLRGSSPSTTCTFAGLETRIILLRNLDNDAAVGGEGTDPRARAREDHVDDEDDAEAEVEATGGIADDDDDTTLFGSKRETEVGEVTTVDTDLLEEAASLPFPKGDIQEEKRVDLRVVTVADEPSDEEPNAVGDNDDKTDSVDADRDAEGADGVV